MIPAGRAAPHADGTPNIQRRLSGAARGYVVMTVATMFTSFVVQVSLAREFGPGGLGEYAATSLFLVALTTASLFGVPFAVSQRVARSEDASAAERQDVTSAAFGLALTATLIAGAAGTLFWPPFAAFAEMSRPAATPLVATAAVAAIVLHFAGSVLLARLQLGHATLLYVAQPLTVGVVMLQPFVPASGSGLAAAGFIGGGAAALVLAFRHRTTPSIRGAEIRLLLRRSVPASIVPYAGFLSTWIDRAVVVGIAGTVGLGWFTAASYMTESIMRLPRTFGTFGVPAYARLAEDPIGARRVLDSHVRILSGALLGASAFLVASGAGLMTVLFREDFALATTALRLLAIALVPIGISLTLAGNLIGTERFAHAGKVMFVLAPLQVIGAVIATSVFSVAGTALSQALVWSFAVFLFALGGAISVRTLFEVAGASVPVWAFAWILGTTAMPWPLAGSLSALAAVVALMLLLIRVPEIRVLRHMVAPDETRGESRSAD